MVCKYKQLLFVNLNPSFNCTVIVYTMCGCGLPRPLIIVLFEVLHSLVCSRVTHSCSRQYHHVGISIIMLVSCPHVSV